MNERLHIGAYEVDPMFVKAKILTWISDQDFDPVGLSDVYNTVFCFVYDPVFT